VSASDGTYADKVAVTWTAVTGATSYSIYRNTINDSGTTAQIGTSTVASYDDTTVAVGPFYHYWVKAKNAAGESDFSNSDSGYAAEPGQAPYGGTPWPIPGVIQAEDYDEGGEGIAYHDTTAGNSGGAYRTDDVDVRATTDAGGGYLVKDIAVGEWLEYTVNVAATGLYDISVRTATANSGKYIHLAFDGQDITGQINIPNNGGYDAGATTTVSDVSLSAGQHMMRICMDTGLFNVNWVQFESKTNSPPVAVDDAVTTKMGMDALISVLDNDSDPDLDTLTVQSVTTPDHGDATINVDNTITYTPEASYVGDDGFDYTISDGKGGTDTATVSVTIGELMWTLTVSSSPIIDVAVSGPPHCCGMTNYVIQCEPGASASFTAPPIVVQPGKTYYFVRWTVGGIAQAGGQATVGFNVNADTSVIAVYKSVSQVRISGRSALFEKTRGYYKATALFTDGSSKVVTGLATWKTNSASLRLVGAGVVDAGSVSKNITRKITARYGGVTGSFNVTIRNR
jgi:hypothetical protein